MVDAEGKLLACNQHALDLFGATREEYESFDTFEEVVRFVMTEKVDMPELIEETLEAAKSRETFEFERLRPDGLVIETVLQALREDSAGAGAARDIWAQTNTLRIKREEPIWTGRGKLMPLHVAKRQPVDRDAPVHEH